jgi:hypothetical protein
MINAPRASGKVKHQDAKKHQGSGRRFAGMRPQKIVYRQHKNEDRNFDLPKKHSASADFARPKSI